MVDFTVSEKRHLTLNISRLSINLTIIAQAVQFNIQVTLNSRQRVWDFLKLEPEFILKKIMFYRTDLLCIYLLNFFIKQCKENNEVFLTSLWF